ncbi:hypothetical protein [Plantactinospora sp. B5E13]|uniref:hypothetical protein n=1 Tax=unclassified Plantactinospora TaxID=2631981 RepID=UPI00325DA261
MSLTPRRSSLVLGLLVLAASVPGLVVALANGANGLLVTAVLGLLLGGLLVGTHRTFEIWIGDDGLALRLRGINRLVAWDEVAAVILDPATSAATAGRARLLLVPADPTGFELPSTEHDPVADRPCLVLLDLAAVRQSADQVAAALTRTAGSRFTDLRQQTSAAPSFTVALRGYDLERVDTLIQRGHAALAGGDESRRRQVAAEITEALPEIPVALRGYDRDQADAYLRDLAARLTA